MASETYLPNAREAVIAYFGRNPAGCYRCYCVRCNDDDPLSDARKVYGDLYIPEGDVERLHDSDICDGCRVPLLTLSRMCQQEHDEQQARWARESRITHVIEMGMRGDVRCRVY